MFDAGGAPTSRSHLHDHPAGAGLAVPRRFKDKGGVAVGMTLTRYAGGLAGARLPTTAAETTDVRENGGVHRPKDRDCEPCAGRRAAALLLRDPHSCRCKAREDGGGAGQSAALGEDLSKD